MTLVSKFLRIGEVKKKAGIKDVELLLSVDWLLALEKSFFKFFASKIHIELTEIEYIK